jgi:hypothetical protein
MLLTAADACGFDRTKAGLVVAFVEFTIDFAEIAIGPLPCLDLIRHAVKRSEGGFAVWIAIARPVVDGRILVHVNCRIEPRDETLDFVAGCPADVP